MLSCVSELTPADTTATVFSLQGATLKFDTQLALQPYLDALDTRPLLEEIRLGGNTYGVEACEAIGKCLSTKKELQVRAPRGGTLENDCVGRPCSHAV